MLAELGAWLRERRRSLDLTQEEAALRAGMTRGMWAKLESGESGTSRKNVPGIAQALQANLTETYQIAGFSPPGADGMSDKDLARFLGELEQKLPVPQRKRFRQVIKEQARLTASLLSDAA